MTAAELVAPVAATFVAIYCRVSNDRNGRAESVERQEANGRKEAEASYPGMPVRVYVDNDLKASDPSVRRPGYERLLADMRAGLVMAVIVREQSRLTRHDWEEFLEIATANGVAKVHQYAKGVVDITRDRLVSRIMAAVDKDEVERTRMRVNEALEARATAGLPKTAPYGYVWGVSPEGKTIYPDGVRAAEVRLMAARVIDGWTMAEVVRDLIAREVPTAYGGKWHSATVKRLLLSPTLYGKVQYRGEVIGAGTWEALLDADTERRVRLALSAPVPTPQGTTATRKRQPVMRHLLTNILTCGRCGAPMKGVNTAKQGRMYACMKASGCGRLSILNGGEVDDEVTAEVLAVLADPGMVAALANDDHAAERAEAQARLGDVTARRSEYARMAAMGEVSPTEWVELKLHLAEAVTAAERDLATIPPPPELDLGDVPERWDGMTLAAKRKVLGIVIAKATVLPPAKRGANRSAIKERVRLTFMA